MTRSLTIVRTVALALLALVGAGIGKAASNVNHSNHSATTRSPIPLDIALVGAGVLPFEENTTWQCVKKTPGNHPNWPECPYWDATKHCVRWARYGDMITGPDYKPNRGRWHFLDGWRVVCNGPPDKSGR